MRQTNEHGSQFGQGNDAALKGVTMSLSSHRTAADPRHAGVLHGHFRRGAVIDESLECQHAVARAVVRARHGDRDALRYLYVCYADSVYGYVSRIVRDEHEAEDITQHVFAKLMTVLPKYEQRSVPFAAWILRVARNVAVDHMRQRRAIPCEEVRELDPRRDSGDAHQTSLGLREALEELPEDQREVIVLRHLVGLSPGEIAGRLGKTEPSVHGLHHRGRGTLRSALVERECAPAVKVQVAA
jgi:RNA polymerase sigma-70 factor (ECF subfamily)